MKKRKNWKKVASTRGRSKEKYQEGEDRWWEGKSGGGPGARVAGEGRGFESGAAFREARSALSSREPGERERTCVSSREKRVILACPLPRCSHSRIPLVPAKNARDKRRKSWKSPIDTLYPSPSPSSSLFAAPLPLCPLLFTPLKSGRGTRGWDDSWLTRWDLRPGGRSRANTRRDWQRDLRGISRQSDRKNLYWTIEMLWLKLKFNRFKSKCERKN